VEELLGMTSKLLWRISAIRRSKTMIPHPVLATMVSSKKEAHILDYNYRPAYRTSHGLHIWTQSHESLFLDRGEKILSSSRRHQAATTIKASITSYLTLLVDAESSQSDGMTDSNVGKTAKPRLLSTGRVKYPLS
jgi:hypothetical protein